MKTYICALTHERARYVARALDLPPSELVYVDGPERLLGLHGGELLVYLPGLAAKAFSDINEEAKIRGMSVRFIQEGFECFR